MTLMLRADEITRLARASHEQAVILAAESEYVRRGIAGQLSVLSRVRRGLNRTYDAGKKEFKMLTKMMDSAGGKLTQTMDKLKGTIVESRFRQDAGDDDEIERNSGETRGDRTLMEFVDENEVNSMVEHLKKSLKQLQVRHPIPCMFIEATNPPSEHSTIL
jgi:autophagy-related protein 17